MEGKAWKRRGFWRRQFGLPAAWDQTLFDVFFGILLPAFCIVTDPIVFVDELHAVFVYGAAAISILALIVWHVSRVPSGFLAGCMAGGALVSLVVGCAILPLTLVGMLLIIGVLGLTPFATSFVLLRNAVRAWIKWRGKSRPVWIAAAALGVLFSTVGPGIVEWRVIAAIASAQQKIVAGEGSVDGAVRTLKRFDRFFDGDELREAWSTESDPDRADRIAEAYLRITGTEISPPSDD